MKNPLFVLAALAAAAFLASPVRAESAGPKTGTLLIVGGGDKTKIWPKFFDLIGGKDAPLVVITTANPDTGEDNPDVQELKALGAKVTILHTTSRKEADTEKFVAPLKTARAVWITGGRQWKLVDSYLGTRTQKEIEGVLARGGVVGGSSAGASIQASFLVRGAKSGNAIMMAPGYETGFGLLTESAVDQHVNTRDRADDMAQVLKAHPALLGIGLDEATGIVVRGGACEVVGTGVARFSTLQNGAVRTSELKPGQKFDLSARAPAPAALAAPRLPVRVAIYSDEGTTRAPDLIEKCLGAEPEKFTFARLSAEDIRTGKLTLAAFDLIVQGGGSASKQGQALGDDGRENIRRFIRGGGGYIGICAGAYLAAADRPYYLRILNARVVDREHWARGGGDVTIRYTVDGRVNLAREPWTDVVRYNQGPLLAKDTQADLPAYVELATFDSEIAKKGAPTGVMKGTSAMALAPFGKGWVFVSSPHPEQTAGLEGIIRTASLRVAQRVGEKL